MEAEKIELAEKIGNYATPRRNFDDAFRTAFDFLLNPCRLWTSGQLENRRAVLKLSFADRLPYARKEGFRTANPSLPFKVLGGFRDCQGGMARRSG
jgi:hypothetical protein